MKSEYENELREIFINESHSLLEVWEEAIYAYEAGGFSRKYLETLFRVAHTFKGNAASMELRSLASFSHRVEDFLAQVRAEKIAASNEISVFLMKCLDVLKIYLSQITIDFSHPFDPGETLLQLETLVPPEIFNQLTLCAIDRGIENPEKSGKVGK